VGFIQLSGRLHRVEFLVYGNSRSPLYEPNFVYFNGPNFDPIFSHFKLTQICHDPRLCDGIHRWPRAYTMYIYSLGHFLTTKGALIDGDWGGSKNDQFSPKAIKNHLKKHEKLIKISVKI